MYQTVNRRKLHNAAKKGLLWAKCDGRYTDDYAGDAACNFGIHDDFRQVAYIDNSLPWQERQAVRQKANAEGMITFDTSDFNDSVGRAWFDSERNKTIFYIHSNLSYTVEIREPQKVTK